MKQITVGILAHVDAGKTTCMESFLFHCGVIRRMGRVDHKDTAMDIDPQEKAHGITIYSKEAAITWNGTRINLIDTPGHVDFSSEMERACSVLDAAIVLISGLDGVQAHTETIMNCLAHYGIPAMFFVNKMDITHQEEAQLLKDIAAHFSNSIALCRKESDEELAMVNDAIMNQYFETGSIDQELLSAAFMNREFFPVLFGSALKDQGVTDLLDALVSLVREPVFRKEFGARGFRVTNEEDGRLTHVRITGGTLKAKEKLNEKEKVDQIRILNGTARETVSEVHAGDIAILSGIRSVEAGEGLGFEKGKAKPLLAPCMVYELETDNERDQRILFEAVSELASEDPTLAVTSDEETGHIRISVMGEMQKEILHHRILEKTGLDVTFGNGRILYLETIRKPVHGAGHFEPLRHYAEVHVRLEPKERDSGIEVISRCSTDELAGHWQTAILGALRSIPHKGVLTGSPLTDVKIILTAGKGHLKHTEGGDFRNAARRAVRQALMKAESILLEPYCSFEVDLSSQYLSRALFDLETKGASTAVLETETGMKITGTGPLRTLINYQAEVTGYTRGTGRVYQQAIGYRECRDPQTIVERFGYDPLEDLRNPPGSVFCAHGTGFNVSWEEADAFMNIPVKDRVSESVYSHRTYHVGEEELQSLVAGESGKNRNPNKQKKVVEEEEKYHSRTRTDLPSCLIADGYNLLHSFSDLKELAGQDLGVAREKLIDELAAYQAYTKERMIVVFDGYKRADNPGSRMRQGNFEVVYTASGETADEYIEKLSARLHKQYRLRVATSDALVQNAVFAHGAMRLSARMIEEEIDAVKKLFLEA